MATKAIQAPPGSPAWFFDEVARAEKAGPTMHVIDLGPSLAKTMLDVNMDNRGVRNVKVTQYAADMTAGHWEMNGEPIIISRDGNLNDGQHRCLAVIESNTTIRTAIVFGIERDTRLTVDQGSMRTAGDFLHMEGTANSQAIAAIARIVMAYERNDGKSLANSQAITSTEVRHRVASDPALAEAATFGHTNYHYSRKFAAGSLIGAAYYILARAQSAEAKAFLERTCRGDGLRMREPAHTLREKLISEGKIGRDRKLTLIFKAWNFHRRGMKVAAGSLNKDLPFPALL